MNIKNKNTTNPETNFVRLRDVLESDLPIFFGHQQEQEAVHMAAFTKEDPSDRNAFDKHWDKILKDKTITIKTILFKEHVVGHIAKFIMFDEPELTYWIDKDFWGKGIATKALAQFLTIIKIRPLFARAAKDNMASIRVLEKCGFEITGYEKAFANARGKEIEEAILKLDK